MKIAHLSDTHFGTEVEQVVAALHKCLFSLKPDLIILSGDITQRAKVREFEAANQFIKSLPIASWLTVAGNHDIALLNVFERFFRPYKRYLSLAGAVLEPIFENEHIQVHGLKTTSRFRHVNGEITEDQLVRINDWLAKAAPHKRKMLVCHHPFDIVLDKDRKNQIINAEKALNQWSSLGLNYIFGGHIHYPFTNTLQPNAHGSGVHIIQAGTACSSRVRNGQTNSFNLIEVGIDEPNIDVCSRYDYDEKENAFKITMKTNLVHSF